jgi:hypothetical protein
MPLGMPAAGREGCTADRAEARSLAEAALGNFLTDWREQPSRQRGDDRPRSHQCQKRDFHIGPGANPRFSSLRRKHAARWSEEAAL